MSVSIISTAIKSAVLNSFKGEVAAINKARQIQDKTIQQALDAMTLACKGSKADFMKGNSKSNTARAEVKGIFDSLVEHQYLAKATAAMYQSSFWMAFENGIPFQRDLASKPKTASVEKTPGQTKVADISRANLDKLIQGTIAMAQALGLTGFANELNNLAADSLDGFEDAPL